MCIKVKIAALLAKATSTSNEHEASAFMTKVHELLNKHQLDLEDILNQDDKVRVERGVERGWVASWETTLRHRVAQFYGCKSINIHRAGGKCVDYVGRESAIITTGLMLPWIKSQVLAAGRKLAAEDVSKRFTLSQHQRFVGNALNSRIAKLIREREAQDGEAMTEVARNSLMTLDQVLAKFKEIWPSTTDGRRTSPKATANARAAAAGIGLNRQTGHQAQARLG
jgi:hypothetical protein